MTSDGLRSVRIERTGASQYRAINSRGTTLDMADGSTSDFTPVELLLAALAGCTAITVDPLVARRSEPREFSVDIEATKVRDELGSRLVDVVMDVVARFDEDSAEGKEAADAARAVLADALRKAEERLCTVSRTVAVGTAAHIRVDS
jgi:putative redox protein